MSDRKLKYDDLYSIEYELNGLTIDDAIVFLKKKTKELSKKYSKMKYISFQFRLIPHYDRDGDYLVIAGVRKENDTEYNKRIKEEQEQEENRKKFELKQLEYLKSKYGGK